MNQKGISPILLFLVIVVVLVVGGVVWYWQKQEEKVPIPSIKEPDLIQFLSISIPSNTKAKIEEIKNSEELAKVLKIETKVELDFDGNGKKEIAFIGWFRNLDKGGELSGCRSGFLKVIKFSEEKRIWEEVFTSQKIETFDYIDIFEKKDLNSDKKEELISSIRLEGTGGFREYFVLAEKDNKILNVYPERLEVPEVSVKPEVSVEEDIRCYGLELTNNNLIKKNCVIYLPEDSNCCPSGGSVFLYYKFDGEKLFLEKSQNQ